MRDFLASVTAGNEEICRLGPLHNYDWKRNGPLLGISDGGDAAEDIVKGAAQSAKAQVAGDGTAEVGLVLDAERMGSSGEVPVGPPEYAKVQSAARGRTFASTNVGVRTNARHYQPYAEIPATGDQPEEVAAATVAELAKFMRDPAGNPRKVAVRLALGARDDGAALPEIAAYIEQRRSSEIAGPELHRVTVLRQFDAGAAVADEVAVHRWIGECADAGIPELALDGPPPDAARVRLGVQGLLNVLPASLAVSALREGSRRGVKVVHRFGIDVKTVARTIWAGLHAARAQGLSAAKYGLTPLTLEEQRKVICQVQPWTEGWTAIPAFYADTPLVTDADVFLGDRMVEAAELWLRMAAGFDAKLVLFDCPDRFTPRIDVANTGAPKRMIKSAADDARGTYTLDEIRGLTALSDELGVGILWSGGIQPADAFELGRMGAAGFFTTGSASIQGPVGRSLESDPRLLSQAYPTTLGVRRVHALSQAGFLTTRAADDQEAADLDRARRSVEAAAANSDELEAALDSLDALLANGWRRAWGVR